MSKKDIEQTSAEIEVLLSQELKTEEFAFEKLKEYVYHVLESSYKKTREDLGAGTTGNALTTGFLILGSILSNSKVVEAANEVNSGYSKTQQNLDDKWYAAKPKLDSLSANQLFVVLYLNQKNGFESVLSFLLR